MKKNLMTIAIVLLTIPANVFAEDKEHGGFLFRFIGAGGGGASQELTNANGDAAQKNFTSTLAHDYRFDFGYSITQNFAIHLGLWGRYIHTGGNGALQQFTGIPIGFTFFLPNNWYISPTFLYLLDRSDRSISQGAFDQAGAQLVNAARTAALSSGASQAAAGASVAATQIVTTAGLGAIPMINGTVTAGIVAGLNLVAAQPSATDAQIQGVIQGALSQGITDPTALGAVTTAATAAVQSSHAGITTAANMAASNAETAFYAANSAVVDANGRVIKAARSKPRGYSYGLDIGWEAPVNADWGYGIGIRYWRINSEQTLTMNFPTGVPGQVQTVNSLFHLREDLFGFTFSATYN